MTDRLTFATFGSPGADRTVLVLRQGAAAMTDPGVIVTSRRHVRVLAAAIGSDEEIDADTYGGETLVEVAAAALRKLLGAVDASHPLGIIGVGRAGILARHLAAELGEGVDRLVLVAVPAPPESIVRGDVEALLARVPAATLILTTDDDPEAGAEDAEWHRRSLGDAESDRVPASGEDPRLALSEVWERALDFAAPGTRR